MNNLEIAMMVFAGWLMFAAVVVAMRAPNQKQLADLERIGREIDQEREEKRCKKDSRYR